MSDGKLIRTALYDEHVALGGNITEDETLFESILNVGWQGTSLVAPQWRSMQTTRR